MPSGSTRAVRAARTVKRRNPCWLWTFSAVGERRLPGLRRYTRYGPVLTALAVLAVGMALTTRNLI